MSTEITPSMISSVLMLERTVSPPEKTGGREGFICSRMNAEITLGMLTPAPSPTTNANVQRLSHDNFFENLSNIKMPNREGQINAYWGTFVAALEKIGTIRGSYRAGFKKLNHVIMMV